MKKLTNFLRSMAFGVILLAIVCAVSVVGSLVEQNQSAMFYVTNYEKWYAVILAMQFDHVFSSWYFIAVTILIGAIWAEEAWSAFWTWDPKEVWALITWILYAIYLHLRLGRHKSGEVLAWYAIISIPVVLFTFIGVNTLLPGLHSYGAVVGSMIM